MKTYTKEEAAIEMLKSPGRCFLNAPAITLRCKDNQFYTWDSWKRQWVHFMPDFQDWPIEWTEVPDPSKPEERKP